MVVNRKQKEFRKITSWHWCRGVGVKGFGEKIGQVWGVDRSVLFSVLFVKSEQFWSMTGAVVAWA